MWRFRELSSVKCLVKYLKTALRIFFFFFNNTHRIKKDCSSPFSECGPQTHCPRVTREFAPMQISVPFPEGLMGLCERWAPRMDIL